MNPQVQERLKKIRMDGMEGARFGVAVGIAFSLSSNLIPSIIPKLAGVIRFSPMPMRVVASGTMFGLLSAILAGRDFGNFMLETLLRGPKVDPIVHAYQQQVLLASQYQAIQLQNQQAIADHFDQAFEGRKAAIEQAKMQRQSQASSPCV